MTSLSFSLEDKIKMNRGAFPFIKRLVDKYHQEKMHPAAFVASYILVLSAQRYKDKLFGGIRNSSLPSFISSSTTTTSSSRLLSSSVKGSTTITSKVKEDVHLLGSPSLSGSSSAEYGNLRNVLSLVSSKMSNTSITMIPSLSQLEDWGILSLSEPLKTRLTKKIKLILFTSNQNGNKHHQPLQEIKEQQQQLENKLYHHAVLNRVSAIDVFRYFQLYKIESYVNDCLVEWASGYRPLHLLFHIPSPEQVLYWQSQGKRVVTAFVDEEGLSKIYKDSYPPYEDRDPLKFSIHDLQHAQKFFNPETFYQQVGFFKCIHQSQSPISSEPEAYKIYKQYTGQDQQCQADMDHVASDMNTSAIHSIGFWKAKWISAEYRRLYDDPLEKQRLTDLEKHEFEVNALRTLMMSWGLEDQTWEAIYRLCQYKPCKGDVDLINSFFHRRGEQQLINEISLS